MFSIKNILVSITAGLTLANIGTFLVGYTAAFVMPTSFANFMWAWDILVVQLLGFGLLAIALAYLTVYLSKLNFSLSVLVVFIIAQLNLVFMDGSINLYWPNILTMLICLFIGWYTACKKYV